MSYARDKKRYFGVNAHKRMLANPKGTIRYLTRLLDLDTSQENERWRKQRQFLTCEFDSQSRIVLPSRDRSQESVEPLHVEQVIAAYLGNLRQIWEQSGAQCERTILTVPSYLKVR